MNSPSSIDQIFLKILFFIEVFPYVSDNEYNPDVNGLISYLTIAMPFLTLPCMTCVTSFEDLCGSRNL